MIQAQGQNITFKRGLKGILLQECQDLLVLIQNQHLIETSDHLSWKWEPTGIFQLNQLVSFWILRGLKCWRHPYGGSCQYHTKSGCLCGCLQKIRSWLSKYCRGKVGKVQHRVCCAPHRLRILSPFFFTLWSCSSNLVLVRWMWKVYQQWDTLSDVINYAVSLGSIQCKAFLTVVSATCWAVWKARNNACFNEQAILRSGIWFWQFVLLFLIGQEIWGKRLKHNSIDDFPWR